MNSCAALPVWVHRCPWHCWPICLSRKKNRSPGMCGAIQPRQRTLQREAYYLGWPGQSSLCSLHGSFGGCPLQPGDPGVFPAPSGSRETQETSPHRLYAKAANRAQQHGENWECLESPPSRPLDTQDGCFSLNNDTPMAHILGAIDSGVLHVCKPEYLLVWTITGWF